MNAPAKIIFTGPPGPPGPEGDVTAELQALLAAAQLAAATATTEAGIATTEAGIATTQAGIATSEAGAANVDRLAADADAAQVVVDRDATSVFMLAAQVAQAAAELAAAAAQAGSTVYVDEPTGRAAVADGASFWVQGATSADGLLLYRRVNAGTVSTLLYTAVGLAKVNALEVRIATVEPVLQIITPYLDPAPTEIPIHLQKDGYYDDYYNKLGPGSYARVNPQTRRLDIFEQLGVPAPALTPDFNGRVLLSGNDPGLNSKAGTVIFGRRNRDDFFQYGPAPSKEYRAFRKGADGAGSIWVTGEGVTPFCISGELSGDNIGLAHHGSQGVSWMNVPTIGAPSYQSFNFLGGFDPGALNAGVSTLVLFIMTGQSTANGTTATPVLTTTCPHTGYITMFNVTPQGGSVRGTRIHGHEQGPLREFERLDIRTLREIVPAHESSEAGSGESQCSQAAYEMQKRLGDTYAVLTATVAIGSQPYHDIGPGPPATIPYLNLLAVIRQAYGLAKMSNLAFKVVVGWPQHEGNVNDDRDTYLAHCVEFQAAVSATVNLITNGAQTNVMFVMNDFTNGTNYARAFTDEGLAQVQFALENPTKGIVATPDYVLPRAVDGTHPTNVGFARDGSYMGRAAANQMLGHDALPLHTTWVGIIGGAIHGTLRLPYGTFALTKTSAIVSDPGNLGFALVRADTQIAVPITSVDIENGDGWVLTPNTPPIGVPLEVSHAYRGTPGNPGGPLTGARSPINDANPDLDYFGVGFPNHLVGQKFTVTY
jgi:hypothetical protein